MARHRQITLESRSFVAVQLATAGSGYVRHIVFNSPTDFLAIPALGELVTHRFLPIGSAPNGDILVVHFDTENCEVGFIRLGSNWQENGPENEYQPIAATLDSLLIQRN
jgi:hypothetical protein